MIIFQNGVLDYLDDLVFILFKEEYFGFMQSSYDYVDKIIDFIENDIATFPSKKHPQH
jgi:flagellar capping protein FliD